MPDLRNRYVIDGNVDFSSTYIRQPIIIVGSRRSGTTLLRTILAGHPDLLVHPEEPQFFLELFQRFGHHISDVPAAVHHLRTHDYFPGTISADALESAYKSENMLSLQDFIHRYLCVWGGRQLTESRPVLKHPRLIFHLDLIFDVFPEATVVHIVRDPRANVASQCARWPHIGTWEAAQWWRRAMAIGHRLADHYPNQCVELRYEDLVTKPESTLQRLSADLSISYEASMLDFELQTRAYTIDGGPKEITYHGLDTAPLTRWHDKLDPADVRLIELGCRQEMVRWGYTPTEPAVSLVRLVFFAAQELSVYHLKMTVRTVQRLLRQILTRL